MKQIFIEDFRVDISRCEVHRNNTIVSLEPKVLQVLLYLVEHQGEVVPRQTLMQEVWPDTIVEANALQRCIGQLRKAFHDDAKQQRVIATFPKNGYSLRSPAQWQQTRPSQRNTKFTAYFSVLLFFALASLVTIKLIHLPSELDDQVELENQATPPDFFALYSPDDRYVLYPKPLEGSNLRHLWLLNRSNDEETLLTTEPGFFQSAAWSPDSLKIIFIESQCSGPQCTENNCSNLKQASLPINEDMFSITNIDLIACTNNSLHSPQWLDNSHVAFIQNENKQTHVKRYSIEQGSTEILYDGTGKLILNLAYSQKADTLAITFYNKQDGLLNHQQQLLFLSLSSGHINTINPALPEAVQQESWYPIWNLENDGLIVASSKGIFNIALDGTVTQQDSVNIPAANL